MQDKRLLTWSPSQLGGGAKEENGLGFQQVAKGGVGERFSGEGAGEWLSGRACAWHAQRPGLIPTTGGKKGLVEEVDSCG
jgi:hypothetical protein